MGDDLNLIVAIDDKVRVLPKLWVSFLIERCFTIPRPRPSLILDAQRNYSWSAHALLVHLYSQALYILDEKSSLG